MKVDVNQNGLRGHAHHRQFGMLGRIGNSGNTDEPHLHIHAERPVDAASLLDAEPVPIRFDGRSLARNDGVRALRR